MNNEEKNQNPVETEITNVIPNADNTQNQDDSSKATPRTILSEEPAFEKKTENPESIRQSPVKVKKTGIPKKTFLLILFLALVTTGLIYLAITPKKANAPASKNAVNVDTTSPQTVLSVSQNLNPLASPSAFLTDINIQTGNNKVTDVQLELSFDPKVLTNIDILPGGFFQNPNVLLKKIDNVNGRISFALGIGPSQPGLSGTGTIATISFTLSKRINVATSTAIIFVPKTQVNAQNTNQSVLKESIGATYELGGPTPKPTSFSQNNASTSAK